MYAMQPIFLSMQLDGQRCTFVRADVRTGDLDELLASLATSRQLAAIQMPR